MTNPEQLRSLLLELADELYAVNKTRSFDSPNRKRGDALMQRARAAAEELENRREPTVDEIGKIIGASASSRSAARAVLARFGGGEVQQ